VRTHAGFDKKFQHNVYTLCIKYTYKYNEKYFIDHALPINHATRLLRNIDWSCLQVNGSRQEEWNRASESALVHFFESENRSPFPMSDPHEIWWEYRAHNAGGQVCLGFSIFHRISEWRLTTHFSFWFTWHVCVTREGDRNNRVYLICPTPVYVFTKLILWDSDSNFINTIKDFVSWIMDPGPFYILTNFAGSDHLCPTPRTLLEYICLDGEQVFCIFGIFAFLEWLAHFMRKSWPLKISARKVPMRMFSQHSANLMIGSFRFGHIGDVWWNLEKFGEWTCENLLLEKKKTSVK